MKRDREEEEQEPNSLVTTATAAIILQSLTNVGKLQENPDSI
jgi:hypothetical protein